MSDDDTNLGSRLRQVFGDIGGVARAADVAKRSQKQIRRYGAGTTEAPFHVVQALAEAAGVRLEWLATGAGEKKESTNGDEILDRLNLRGIGPTLTDKSIIKELMGKIDAAASRHATQVSADKKEEILALFIDARLGTGFFLIDTLVKLESKG